MTGVRLRPATWTDLDAVVRIERACYPDPWPRSGFEGLPDDPRALFVVAERSDGGAGDVVGYVVAWFVVDQAELANLAVAPEARRTGIGQRLLDAVLEEGSRRGTAQVFLEVRASNTAALALYERSGFQHVSRRRDYYRKPQEDALVLRRTLEP